MLDTSFWLVCQLPRRFETLVVENALVEGKLLYVQALVVHNTPLRQNDGQDTTAAALIKPCFCRILLHPVHLHLTVYLLKVQKITNCTVSFSVRR